MNNLLEEPLVRARTADGVVERFSLPAPYVALQDDRVTAFPALRPHQRHAWHSFLAQLATIALDRQPGGAVPRSAAEWATAPRSLTPGFPNDADLRVRGVVRLEPAGSFPTIDDVASALQQPARPLFIGRKACLPAAPIFDGWVEAAGDVRGALRGILPPGAWRMRALWPASEGLDGASRTWTTTDERNWSSGFHGGGRRVCEGELSLAEESP